MPFYRCAGSSHPTDEMLNCGFKLVGHGDLDTPPFITGERNFGRAQRPSPTTLERSGTGAGVPAHLTSLFTILYSLRESFFHANRPRCCVKTVSVNFPSHSLFLSVSV